MAELLRTHPLEARHPLMAWSTAFERLPDTVSISVEQSVIRVTFMVAPPYTSEQQATGQRSVS